MQFRHSILLLGTLVALQGCKRSRESAATNGAESALPPGHVPIAPTVASDLLPQTQSFLDSGNAAFRKQDFNGALSFYAKASAAQPEHAAPWFGTYMVGQATKNKALSDSALRMVRERAPEMQAHPGAVPPGTSPASPYSPHQPTPAGTRPPAAGRSS